MVLVLLAKQCFTGWMYWGRYGAEERQTTGWLVTCRNTFPCQTTNIMEGEPLGGRWWVLRIEKGGGRLDSTSIVCLGEGLVYKSFTVSTQYQFMYHHYYGWMRLGESPLWGGWWWVVRGVS